MKFPKIKLSKVLASKQGRPVLEGAMVKLEDVEIPDLSQSPLKTKTTKHLVAYGTNAYVFARVDLGAPESEKDVEGPIPTVALKHMERGVEVELGEEEITAGITSYERVISDALTFRGERSYSVGDEVKYPEWKDLYPEFGKNVLTFGVNPRLLADLADAIGSGSQYGVVIEIDLDKLKDVSDGNHKGSKTVLSVMKVKTMSPLRDKAEGLIMPIRVNA